MNGSCSQWMASTALRLAWLSAVAGSMSAVAGWGPEVLLEGTVLQLLRHPVLNVLVKLTAVNAALIALSLSDNFPCGLQGIGAKATSIEGHLRTVDSTINNIEVGSGETEAAGVNLVQVAEDFELKLSRES